MKRRDLFRLAPASAAALLLPGPAAAGSGAGGEAARIAYLFFRPSEALFVERLADHMVPADDLSPSGNDIGIPVYIDRALASGWGKGDRVYLQGPFAQGTRNQGYQLALTPERLFRLGTEALFAHSEKVLGESLLALSAERFDALLHALREGRAALADGVPPAEYFSLLHSLVREGLFSDPAYGGNRGKAGWKLIGFPGVIAVYGRSIGRYRNIPYRVEPVSIADVSGRDG